MRLLYPGIPGCLWMHVEISINSAGPLRTINEVKCRCLIAHRSIHQGHGRFILVMNLEEGKRFLCVWPLYYVSYFCRFANGARCQDIDQVLLHGDYFLLSAFSCSCFIQNTFIRSKLPTAVCWSREEREEVVKSTCFMSKASQIIRSILRLLRR